MPQLGWIYKEQYVLHADMMAYAETYPEDFPYVPEMLHIMFNRSERDFMSPTTFQGCPRQLVLRRETGVIPELGYQHDGYYVELGKAWAAARGTAMHESFERQPREPNALIERRYAVDVSVDGEPFTYYIAGKPDKLVVDPLASDGSYLIVDYKSAEDKKLAALQHSPKSGWVAQLSCYKYILAHNGVNVGRARIQVVGMERPVAVDLTAKLWSTDKTERYLVAMAKKFIGVYDGTYNLSNLPPMLDFTLDDNAWLCLTRVDKTTGVPSRAWCPVQEVCFAAGRVGK